MKQTGPCVAVPTTQGLAAIIRNSKQPIEKVEPFGLRAAWLHFANELELRRLATLHIRIERRRRGLDDLMVERRRIMNRCIRRMRRHTGKN